MSDPIAIIFKVVGSEEPYFRLVDEFYAGVENDLLLRPLFRKDLTGSKERLALFLI
ncbi:MAG: hypothetical protein K8F91_15550 [Candidatus Obscuribacterales bacterium]|nr:hypothetical protein [Candidatus Obscuribacterales bacterium]